MRLRLGLFFVIPLIILGLSSPITVNALGCDTCTVQPYKCYDEYGVEQTCYLDGCHCLETSCPPGQYEAPNGQCYDVGIGGACQCGAYPNGSCRSCGDTGGGYQFPTCGGSQVLACATPPVYAGGCTFKATCGNNYFPSAFYPDDCAGEDNPNRGACQDNCGCCNPGEEYVCSGGNCSCQSVCGLNAPRATVTQGSSPSQAIISWINAKWAAGGSTLLRFGSNASDVDTGCYGGTCAATGSYPAYVKPADPASPTPMYYYKYSAGDCVITAPKPSYAQCEYDVDAYVKLGGQPDSPGVCYPDYNTCRNNSLGSVTVNGIVEDVVYRLRVVNYQNLSCMPTAFGSHTVSCVPSAPAVPTTSSPSSPSSSPVLLSWAESNWGKGCPTHTEQYTVYVKTDTTPYEAWLSNIGPTQTSANYYATPGVTYTWKVKASNGSFATESVERSFMVPLPIQIAGYVYNDTTNSCGGSGMSGVLISVDGVPRAMTNASGYYAATVTAGTHSVTVTPPATHLCSTGATCSSGCTTKTGVASGSSGINFYLTNNRAGWWQAVGGSIYSAGSVRSELPSASTPLIDAGTGGAVGALMRATSTSPDLGSGSVTYSAQTRYRGKTMNYDYFAAHLGVTPNTTNYWSSNTMTEPTAARDFYYLAPTGGNPATIAGLTVGAGESYVMMVNGDLQIAGNVTVATGGFLAVIVNGNITVSPAVTSIQGLYVADGTLVTQTSGGVDVAANFAGSMVAWGGVDFNRDLGTGNVTTPAEKFTYRPDLLLNMPESLKVFALQWQEVVPGSF